MTTDTATPTETPTTTTPASTLEETATAAGAEIGILKARAKEALDGEMQAIAKTAGRDDGRTVALRLQRKNSLDELVHAAAWLAGDLVDVLHKVAAGTELHAVISSDFARRIREAEIRLRVLRELGR